jgi:ATP/maltotriose-dependent transcriptional regulator MalT
MLVGRDLERLGIAEVLGRVRVGRGAVMLVTGSPGLGKTALLEYAAYAADGMRVLRATGAEFEQRFAWAGLHQLLQPVLDHLDGLSVEQAAALRGALRLDRSTGDDPFLVSLGVLTLLSLLAEDAGLLCLVDDAQWLDDQSADALRFAARRLDRDPVGLLVAARDVPAGRFALDRWPRLNLAGLSGPEMAELLGRRAGVAVAGGVAERLLGYADGNPLALVEMTGALTAEQLSGHQPLPDPLPLRPGLEAVFLDQVRRLTAEAQDLLLVAACGQGTVWGQVMAAPQRLNLSDRAEELERSGLVTIEASAVRFRHPLVRSAVLAAAPFTRRRVIHLALAEVLVGDDHSDQRAWHRAAACHGTDAEVADELAASAERARARSGFAAAAAALQRAADLSPDAMVRGRRLVAAGEAALAAGQPEWALECAGRAEQQAAMDQAGSGRVAAVRGYTQLRGGLLSQAVGTLREGAASLAETDPTAALEMLSAASEAAGLAGDVDGILAVADQARTIVTTPSGARPLSDLLSGIADILSGQPERGSATVGAAVDHLTDSRNVRWLIWAVYGAIYQGDMGRAVQLIDAAAHRARASGALDNLPLLLHGVAMAEGIGGRYPDAEAAAAEGLRLARETGQRTSECLNLAVLASITAMRGEENRCREFADAALALAIPHGITLAAAWASWALAVLDLGAGRPAEALSRLRSLAEPDAPAGHFLVTRSTTPDLVEAAMRCGDTETAQRATTWLGAVVANSPSPASGARLARCRGLMAAEPVEASRWLREAVRLYDLGKERFGRARTELLLGAALRRAKRRTEAREALRSALTVFDALGAAAWAERARRELRALGAVPAPALSGGLGVLTPQELQVSRLVAMGASNREIAAQLFLSPRTVEYHLYKVYPKLGVGSRTELALLVLTADAATGGRS